MPDEKRDLFHYTSYFSKQAPSLRKQGVLLLAIGIVAGIVSVLLAHSQLFMQQPIAYIEYGISTGILVVSLPALLTATIIKAIKQKVFLKHLMYATLVSTTIYALFMVVSSAALAIFQSATILYIILLVGNASIFMFWMVIGKFLFSQNRGANIIAAVQPILNILFLLSLGKYALGLTLPATVAIIKLVAGMLIFLIAGYVFFYIIDFPLKRSTNISGVKVFTVMVNQWLYSLQSYDSPNFSFGVRKDISTDVLVLKTKKGGYKAIFVKPDIHYGPFAGFGGAIATEHIGNYLHAKYNTTAIVLHGPVNIANNPVSSSQVYTMAKNISSHIDSMKKQSFTPALGNMYEGSEGPCRAINIKMNGLSMITLSKAPLVTEDIAYEIGQHYKQVALKDSQHAIIIDAHNSRSESASQEELKGVYFGSKYAAMYDKAILQTLNKNSIRKVKFGAAQQKIAGALGNPKDIANGYSSFCVFQFGNKKFGMIHFDCNNILPKLREDVIKYVRKKYHIEIEVYTTDTHAVNSLALPSSNVLGRYTTAAKLLPAVDALVGMALSSIEEVTMSSSSFTMKNFRVWGENAEEEITKASKEALRMLKYYAPFVIAAAFIIASWVVYST